jgi:hypothetical protein
LVWWTSRKRPTAVASSRRQCDVSTLSMCAGAVKVNVDLGLGGCPLALWLAYSHARLTPWTGACCTLRRPVLATRPQVPPAPVTLIAQKQRRDARPGQPPCETAPGRRCVQPRGAAPGRMDQLPASRAGQVTCRRPGIVGQISDGSPPQLQFGRHPAAPSCSTTSLTAAAMALGCCVRPASAARARA